MKHSLSITSHFLSVLFIALLIFNACGNPKTVRIVDTNFKGEVERTAGFEFTFNQDLITEDRILETDNRQLFEIEPKLSYRLVWKEKDKVLLRPYDKLAAGTKYSLSLNKTLFNNKFKKTVKEDRFECFTPDLKLIDGNVYWNTSETMDINSAVIGIDLEFSENLLIHDLQKKLKIEIEGKSYAFQILDGDRSNKFTIEINGIAFIPDDQLIKFTVDKGLAMYQSPSITTKAMHLERRLVPPSDLEVTGIDAKHDGIEGRIMVSTSQGIKKGELKSKISMKPEVPFFVDPFAGGFIIKSERFDFNISYKIIIDQSLTGIFDGKMEKDFEDDISFGKLEPTIEFVDKKALYLSPKGQRNIALNIASLTTIKVEVYKIFENNLVSFFRDGLRWDYSYDFRANNLETYGELVYKEQINTADLERNGRISLLSMNFKDELIDYNGIYILKVADLNNYPRADKLVSFSDLGIIVKQSEDKVHVFVNSIKTALPVPGAKVKLISRTNQNIEAITTNQDGVAVLKDLKQKMGKFDLVMFTVQKGKDFNYMQLENTDVKTARFNVSGKRSNKAKMNAFIYGDRNLYRPGETVHLSTIVRGDDWGIPSKMPVNIKFLYPDGRELKTARKTLDNEGSCDMEIAIPFSAITGTYTVEVYSASDVLLNSESISIEEFMPDRIKVDLSLNRNNYMIGDDIVLSGKAVNLFGPPAANRNYELELKYKRKLFKPKGFSNYSFFMGSREVLVGEMDSEGQTDENGEFSIDFEVPEKYRGLGVLEASFWATVFDESGRPVNRVKEFDVYTQDVFYGIGPMDRYVHGDGEMQIPLAAVNKDGEAMDTTVHIEILHHQWRTVLESNSRGYYRYKSQKDKLTLVSKDIDINGKTNFPFYPKESGSYLIRISPVDSTNETYLEKSFYTYRFGHTQSTSFAVNKEGRIDITYDKEKYNVGETATILLKAPFEGRMLIAIERDELVSYAYRNTDKKVVEYKLKIKEEHLPNVFVSATLIRPMEALQVPLTVAHGYEVLKVDKKAYNLDVKIIATEKSRSRKKQRIRVKTTPNTKVALAVVDEGVLQIKDYQTPDPYNYFYQKRALDIKAYDIYPYLFNEVIATNKLTGGGYGLAKRVNPVTNRRVKLVNFWSGIKQTDANGVFDYEIDIPEFSGDLRIMAVAYKGKKFGSSDANMKVADPLVVSSGLPRFLSPNDTVIVPVILTNTTDKADTVKATICTDGPMSVVSEENIQLPIDAKAEKRLEFKILADNNIGAGQVVVSVDALDETYSNTTDISVRPPSSLHKKSDHGTINAGQVKEIDLSHSYIPESVAGELIIGSSPLTEMSEDIKYLLRYPHGCVEQTTSKAFPQIYYYDLAKAVGHGHIINDKQNKGNPNYNVKEAIKKLERMLNSDGAMSYWPGGRRASWWGSVFATHFLIEAHKAGFEVKENTLRRLTAYLQQRLRKKETYKYHYYDANNTAAEREIAHKEIPYTLFLLALTGKPDISTMNYYKTNNEQLSLDGKYLLAVAYALAGDRTSFNDLLPGAYEGETPEKELDGSFSSSIRDRALILNALAEVAPDHEQITVLTKQLQRELIRQTHRNTQERVFSILALGKVAHKVRAKDLVAKVKVNDETIAQFEGKEARIDYAGLKDGTIEIEAEGEGNLYYFWQIEGLSKDGVIKEKDNQLLVRRSFYDRSGKKIYGNEFEQNDLIVVELALQTNGSSNIPNVVITDMLPAGFEIENPRISDKNSIDWLNGNAIPEHQDFRDDRIHLFTNATNHLKKYYYVVRAVSPGYFHLGPASADAMYEEDYYSYNGAGTVKILAKN